MVVPMPDNTVDPSGNTQAFRAFTEAPEPAAGRSRTPLIVVGVVVAVALLALTAFLALS